MDIANVEKNFRSHKFRRLKASKARDAAVMIPLVTDADGALGILFEVRSRKIIQGGEICFPGGRIDEGEKPMETVIREAHEELEIPEENIDIIAPMFIMNGISDSLIYAYLGSIRDYKQSFSEDEVENVFILSLDELISMEPKESTAEFVFSMPEDFHYELVPGGRDYSWAKRSKNYYFYETPYGVIWGMTAELLYSFISELKAVHTDTEA